METFETDPTMPTIPAPPLTAPHNPLVTTEEIAESIAQGVTDNTNLIVTHEKGVITMSTPAPQVTAESIAQDVVNLAAELVTAVAFRKAAEGERKAALSEYDALVASWKARLEPAKDLEESLRLELIAMVEAVEAVQARMLEMAVHDPGLAAKIPSVPKLDGVSFAWRNDVEILDPGAIPREWCVPDAARVKKAVLAGIPIPGCAAVQKRSVTVR